MFDVKKKHDSSAFLLYNNITKEKPISSNDAAILYCTPNSISSPSRCYVPPRSCVRNRVQRNKAV